MVAQCTTIEPAATTPDSPNSASTPAAAARTASGSQAGRCAAIEGRRTTREPTPICGTDEMHRQHAAEGA